MAHLDAQSLSFYCSLEQRYLLNNIDLAIDRGEKIVIAGEDITSLSALAVLLAGLGDLHLTGEVKGKLQWDGESNLDAGKVVLIQGSPAEQLSGCCFSVRDELVFGAENIGLPVEEILTSMRQLADIFELNHLMAQDPFSLSGGEQQRLILASLLIMQPEILILQDPFSQLAPNAIEKLADWLNKQSSTSIIYLTTNSEIYQPWAKVKWRLTQGELINMALSYDAATDLPTSTDLPRPSSAFLNAQPLLEVENLSFYYQAEAPLLDELSFSIQQGEIVALQGDNGCGKSTLLNLLQGHLEPNSGEIKLQGDSIIHKQAWQRARDIGFVFQQPEQQIFCATVKEELTYGPKCLKVEPDKQADRAAQMSQFFELDEALDDNPLNGNYPQLKRLNLASVTSMMPKLLLLDEPSSGIGEQQREKLIHLIKQLNQQGMTFLIVSHDATFVHACCHRSLVL